MSIAQELIQLAATKAALKQAIEAKGVVVGDIGFSGYAPLIASILTTPVAMPPENSGLPVVSGGTGLGDLINATTGSWTNTPTSFETYWSRNGSAIAGSENSLVRYIAAGDSAADLRFHVVASNADGESDAIASAPLTVQTFVAPSITGDPSVSGTLEVGQTLTFAPAPVAGNPIPTTVLQVMRGGVAVAGAVGTSYTPVSADVGPTMTVRQTSSNGVGSPAVVSSAGFTVAAAQVAPSITGLPTFAGTAQVGQTLTATAAPSGGSPPPTNAWQWLRNGVVISGATASAYLLVTADEGATVAVRQTASNGVGTAAAATSSGSVVASAPAFNPATETGMFVYDASDFSTLFTDAAKTTNATAAGQDVWAMDDMGLSGLHVSASTLTEAMPLQQDSDGRYYLNSIIGTNKLSSAATLDVTSPSFIAALVSYGSGTSNEGAPTVALIVTENDLFSLTHRASNLSARARARIITGGIAQVEITGTIGEITQDLIGVHHATLDGGVLSRGVEAVDVHTAATTWTTQTLANAKVQIGGPPRGGPLNGTIRFYAVVVAVGSDAVAKKAEIIAWLQAKK